MSVLICTQARRRWVICDIDHRRRRGFGGPGKKNSKDPVVQSLSPGGTLSGIRVATSWRPARGPGADRVQRPARHGADPDRRRTADCRLDGSRLAVVLRELRRTDAFDRKVLVIIPTTGTGWVDPAAARSIEALYSGDTALVACSIRISA